MSEPRSAGVQSVHRALDLLEMLAQRGGTQPIAELAAATGLPLPTVHRMLRTLAERGYVRQLPDRRYALGFGLLALGTAVGTTVGAGTERILQRLVDALGETANLAVLDGDRVVYVAQVPGRHNMRMFTQVGRRVDPHCTAVGKALLARLPATVTAEILARTGLERRTGHTVGDLEGFLAVLEEVRERGYATDEEEQEIGVRCVAVAVPTRESRVAVSISGPAPRMTDELVAQAVPLLTSIAAELAADLE